MILRKVYCATLGCDKNLVDSEALLGCFARSGIAPVGDPEEADLWVLNTCGFIDAARRDSEETLRDLIAHKGERRLIVCGCWSQEHGDEIQRDFPGVDLVAGVGQFDRVVAAVTEGSFGERPGGSEPGAAGAGAFPLAGPPLVADPMQVEYTGLIGRPLLTPPHIAFVKIGEGCNFNCTFCRIPLIRGRQRSRPQAQIVQEVRGLVAGGVREIQLVSQNTSDFGRDTGESLLQLVQALDGVEGLKRIRLLYLYPGLVAVEDLLRLLELRAVVPYLEIPVQHASPRILQAMRRPGRTVDAAGFFGALRAERPDVVLRSTALLGFPGEEEEDVTILADFLAEVEFDHLGTYRYSPERGTPAANLPGRVPDEVILDREALIMDLQSEISLARQESRLDQIHEVVVDEVGTAAADDESGTVEVLADLAAGSWADDRERRDLAGVQESAGPVARGRSHHYGYDLDGSVLLPGGGLRPGDWVRARFAAVSPYDTWAVPTTDGRRNDKSKG